MQELKSKLTKESKLARQSWIQDFSQWGVHNYLIDLFINVPNLNYDLKDGISLDVEDNEKDDFVGLGIYDPRTETCYYWNDWNLVKNITIPKFIAHNGISDIQKLRRWGFKIDESWLIYDTQLMAHIIDSSRKNYGLKNLVKQDLNIEYPSYEELCGKKGTAKRVTLDKLPLELSANYNAMDCYTAYQLYLKQKSQLPVVVSGQSQTEDYYEQIEAPCAVIFKQMSDRGITIDLGYLRELKDVLEDQREPIEASIKNELGNINLNSPKQLLGALHAKEIYPEFKGKPSTDKRALSRLEQTGVVSRILWYSELETLLSSFVYPYLERSESVVHPFFNQCGTRTGRLSCSNPNLQQIPKRTATGKMVRKMFIPREGMLLGDGDLAGIEPRLLAHLSNDTKMIEMFVNGLDFHSYFADRLNISRERAKIFDLETYYRATAWGVARTLNCSESSAQVEIDRAWKLFPEMQLWQDKLIWDSKRSGYCTTLMGRRIKIERLDSFNKRQKEAAQRQLINNLVQGSAAEVLKLGMLKIAEFGVHMLVQVHDEVLFESKIERIDIELQQVKDCLENAITLSVPLKAEMKKGFAWANIK